MLKIKRTIIVRVEKSKKAIERMNDFIYDFPYYKNNIRESKNKITYSGPEAHYFVNYMDHDRDYDIKTVVHKKIIWG